jgi:hypothetical protein
MLTREEIIASFKAIDARVAAAKAKATPKPAQVKFDERCAEKPTEAVIRDAAIHNEAAAERLRQERATAQANYQAILDRHWQSMLDAQREHRMVWDYNPIELYERGRR